MNPTNGRLSPMSHPAEEFQRLLEIIERLRAPDGCPWDRKQTPESMRRFLLEEMYEAVEAIDSGDPAHVAEELGDVTMLVAMIARMYEEVNTFSMGDVLAEVNAKLIRRHPHVFADSDVSDADDVVRQWHAIKVEQEGKKKPDRLLDGVSKGLPPLERANELQRKAAKVGFDWPSVNGVFEKILEELQEVRAVLPTDQNQMNADAALAGDGRSAEIEAEVGDLLFSAVNLARYLGVDPAIALHRTNTKFIQRFGEVEQAVRASGSSLDEASLEELDELWNRAKAAE
jgi:tetrapyrrole methylase family protein/MazG family protein